MFLTNKFFKSHHLKVSYVLLIQGTQDKTKT